MGYDSLDLGYDLHYDTELLGVPSGSHRPTLSSSQGLPQEGGYWMGPPTPAGRQGGGLPFVDNIIPPAPTPQDGGGEAGSADDGADPFAEDSFEDVRPAEGSGEAPTDPNRAALQKAEAAASAAYDKAISQNLSEADAKALSEQAGQAVYLAEMGKSSAGGGKSKRRGGAKRARGVDAAPPESPAKLRFREALRAKGITEPKVQELILAARPLPAAKATVVESEDYYSRLSKASNEELLQEARSADAKSWLDHYRKQGVPPKTAYHNAMMRGLLPEDTSIPEAWPPLKKPVFNKGDIDFSKVDRSQKDMAASVDALRAKPVVSGGPAEAAAAAERDTTQVNVRNSYIRLAQDRYQISPEESEKRLAAMGFGPRDDFDPQAAASALFALKSGVQGDVLVLGKAGTKNFGELVLTDSNNLDPVVPMVKIPGVDGEVPLSSPAAQTHLQTHGSASLQGANPMGTLALRQDEEKQRSDSILKLGTDAPPQGFGLEASEWQGILSSDVYGSPPLFSADGIYQGKDEADLKRLRSLEKQVRAEFKDIRSSEGEKENPLDEGIKAWKKEKYSQAVDYHRNQMFGHMHRFGLDKESVGAWMSSQGYLSESPDVGAMAEDNQRFAAIPTDDKTAISELKRDILAEKGNASAPVFGPEADVLGAYGAAQEGQGGKNKGGGSDLAEQKEMAKYQRELDDQYAQKAEARAEAREERKAKADHARNKEMTNINAGWQAYNGLLSGLNQMVANVLQNTLQLLGNQVAVGNQTLQTILQGLYGPGQAGKR